MPYTSEFNR